MRKIRIDEDAFAELGRLADGGDIRKNDFRHTYATYGVAYHQNADDLPPDGAQ